jgi:hypothetical protein
MGGEVSRLVRSPSDLPGAGRIGPTMADALKADARRRVAIARALYGERAVVAVNAIVVVQ